MAVEMGVSSSLARILRPQAAYRWLLPYVASITPQYVESVLRGALAGNHVQQWELFDLMLDTWPELSAVQQELVLGLQRKRMVFESFREEDEKPSASAQEKLKVVTAALKAMRPEAAADENDLSGTVVDIMDGWFRGVTALEIDWQVADLGSVGQTVCPRATFWVHPVCFGWSSDGKLGLRNPGMEGYRPGSTYSPFVLSPTPQSNLSDFPPNKFLIGIHKAKSGTALGGAMLRPLAWWWCAANFASDWLLNLAQVFGLPFRWANYYPNAPQATVDAICTMLQNMGSAGWAAFPTGTTLELKDAGSAKGSDHSPQGELLDRADRYARTLILGQTMTGGQGTTGKGGGQAFGKIEKDVKDDRIDAAGAYVSSVLNQQLIMSILALNFGDTSEPPTCKFLEDEEASLTEAERDQLLGSMVEIPKSFIRKKYDLPEPEAGEETFGGAPPPKPGQQGKPGQTDLNAPKLQQGHPDPLEAKDAEFEHWLGKYKDDFLKAFDNDLHYFRTAIEIALKGSDEKEQDARLLELYHELPKILQHFNRSAKSPRDLSKIIAKSFSKGFEEEKTQ